MEHGLGRLAAPDPRDTAFLLAPPQPPPTRTRRTWFDNGWWGDQGPYPYCVGYAWAHFIEDSPRTHPTQGPLVAPQLIYSKAQAIDEWAGTPHDGTSVRAGAKALQNMGVVAEYRWAFDVDTIARNVLEAGPVVMGTDWHDSMFDIDRKGFVHPDGPVVGGHAYVVNGYSTKTETFRAKNSWSRDWGHRGHFLLHADDLAALLAHDGEACMALETKG